MDIIALKILERAKRRAGTIAQGEGQHVNLPMAWTELAQLAQCKGNIQKDSLDTLIASLDISPLEKYHIPALFFLAETMLYWFRTEVIPQPYLRTTEIKLLKMGQLVFTRLFYHHMAGHLQGHFDFKNRLYTYLDGLQDSQKAYSPYPNALLSLRFVIEVGKIIMADTVIEPGEVKEGDVAPQRNNIEAVHSATQELYERRRKDGNHSAHSAAISSSVHDLSPTLWHALDVWRCTNHLGGGIEEALKSLSHCGLGLANESWIDGMIGLSILAEAAKTSIFAMKVLHRLALGVKPSTMKTSGSSIHCIQSDFSFCSNDSPKFSDSKSNDQSLSDIFELCGKTTHDLKKDQSDDELELEPVAGPSKPYISRGTSFESNLQLSSSDEEKLISNVSKATQSSIHSDISVPGTGWKAEYGSDLPEGRMSNTSSVPTFTNTAIPDIPGIRGWHWEVAITYCDILGDLCLHGNTASIQRMALAGVNTDLAAASKHGLFTRIPMSSAGLLDLAFFKPVNEVIDGGHNDWSWRIRYGALQALVKICRCLAKDTNREGLRDAAWYTVIKAQSQEKDDRVLEALKVGNVKTGMESILAVHARVAPSIGARIATGLACMYLPPLPPLVTRPSTKTPQKKAVVTKVISERKPAAPLRTSLKEEIMLATALYEPPVLFKDRVNYDLRRIVEDQWRKQLHELMDEEEEERIEKLTEHQLQEERSLLVTKSNKSQISQGQQSEHLQ